MTNLVTIVVMNWETLSDERLTEMSDAGFNVRFDSTSDEYWYSRMVTVNSRQLERLCKDYGQITSYDLEAGEVHINAFPY